MQTAQRLVSKQLNKHMQQAIAQYLQSNTVTQCAAAANTMRNSNKTQHIGKNCATRRGARV